MQHFRFTRDFPDSVLLPSSSDSNSPTTTTMRLRSIFDVCGYDCFQPERVPKSSTFEDGLTFAEVPIGDKAKSLQIPAARQGHSHVRHVWCGLGWHRRI